MNSRPLINGNWATRKLRGVDYTLENIRFDLYPGAYGLTLRVDLMSHSVARNFHALLGGLASGDVEQVPLSSLRARITGFRDLIFQRSQGPVRKSVHIVDRTGPIFAWVASCDEWGNNREMVGQCLDTNGRTVDARFLGIQGPWEHYLSNKPPDDDALIEVAFMEGSR